MTTLIPPPGGGHLGDALSALLDEELGPDDEVAAAIHLSACAACAQELEAVRLARTWVRGLPQAAPPFGFYERMLLDRGRPLRRRAGVAAFAACAAAVTVLGVGSPRQVTVSPSVARLVEAHAAGASLGNDLLSKLAPMAVPVKFGR